MSAVPIYIAVPGSPFQPGNRVRVVDAIDTEMDYEEPGESYVGHTGTVEYLEYSCGCSQTFPHDPMIGVKIDGRVHSVGDRYGCGGGQFLRGRREFWHEELELLHSPPPAE